MRSSPPWSRQAATCLCSKSPGGIGSVPELEPALGTIPVILGAKCLRERGAKRRFESDIIWGSAGLRPDPIFVTSSVEAVRSMVADGMDVTILSDMVYRPWSLEGQRIELRNIVADIPTMDVGLAWNPSRAQSPAARTFHEFMSLSFGGAGN